MLFVQAWLAIMGSIDAFLALRLYVSSSNSAVSYFTGVSGKEVPDQVIRVLAFFISITGIIRVLCSIQLKHPYQKTARPIYFVTLFSFVSQLLIYPMEMFYFKTTSAEGAMISMLFSAITIFFMTLGYGFHLYEGKREKTK
eukprot:gb/GECH01013860.1/.p1 GENE.gb/GECH01013860.1/~~gb/GECH01013860.1/.p1  ORF type:complete len:141 (+),score=17.31 gb/GECH01013860.1/:1-423(+)